jgi:hypothetical protein
MGQNGSVTIDGSGSAWHVNGRLFVDYPKISGFNYGRSVVGNEIVIQNGGNLNVKNDIHIAVENTLKLVDGSIQTDSYILIAGTLDISGTSKISGNIGSFKGGQINIAKDSVVTFSGPVNPGMFIDEGSQVIFAGVHGLEDIEGPGTVVAAGKSIFYGESEVEGNLILRPNNKIDLGILEPEFLGPGFSYMKVGGILELGGDLNFSFSLIDPYTPQFGDVFDLFIAASIIGDFDNILYPTFANGLEFQLTRFVDPDSHKHILRATVVPIPGLAWLFAPISWLLLSRKRH